MYPVAVLAALCQCWLLRYVIVACCAVSMYVFVYLANLSYGVYLRLCWSHMLPVRISCVYASWTGCWCDACLLLRTDHSSCSFSDEKAQERGVEVSSRQLLVRCCLSVPAMEALFPSNGEHESPATSQPTMTREDLHNAGKQETHANKQKLKGQNTHINSHKGKNAT